MEAEKKTRGARNQKCYRDEVKEINKINAKFMAPWLVKRFFLENKLY